MRIENHVNLLSQKWKQEYGCKVIKICLSMGIECPNRRNGGCIFCQPLSFIKDNPVENKIPLKLQIESALDYSKKHNHQDVKYIAYFQDETSTATSIDNLKATIDTILEYNCFEEIIFSTRPDYINDQIIRLFAEFKIKISIELGIQTIHEKSLSLLNRNHTHIDTINALDICSKYKIPVGVHLIIGIPNEKLAQILETIDFVNNTTVIKDIKFHNLVIYKGTKLASLADSFDFMTYDEYINTLGQVISHLDTSKTVSRLFTSNVNKSNLAINPFPKYKTSWLKDLWILLKNKNIIQGSNLK